MNIQIYLEKMFDNISALNFIRYDKLFISKEEGAEHMSELIHPDSQFATAMISLEKEEMNFLEPVECNGKVEIWMANIEKEMKRSNRWITKEATFYYRFKQNRIEWMRKYIGMVILAVNQLWGTWEIEEYVINRIDKIYASIKTD
jgi:dynein heavy chain